MYPRLIAICGNPGAGKSEVQKILSKELHYQPVDDGMPLRAFCIQHLGMTHQQVNSQEGKAEEVEILGQTWQRRKILGDYGKALESMFGKEILPYMATIGLEPDKRYSFGSVRMNQGRFYKSQGGIVIGVRNPRALPSPHAFDWFNPDLVDIWIENDCQQPGVSDDDARMDLGIRVLTALSAWRARQ